MGLLGWLSRLSSWVFGRTGRPDPQPTGLYLHRLLLKQLEHQVDPWPLLADLIVERMQAQGVRVSKRDRRRIEERARNNRWEGFRLESWKWWQQPKSLTITLTEADSQAIVDRIQRVIDKLPAILPEVIEETAPSLLEALRHQYQPEIRRDERDFRRLEAEIAELWREPFASLSFLIELTYRVSFGIAEYLEQQPTGEPRLVEVLTRLHTRGVHVAREVLTLLRCGYADAAMARWRTLHEIAVVASFVAVHGEVCAQRYLDHTAVESLKAATQYQKSAERLGFPLLTSEELAEFRADRDAAVVRHGPTFAEDYGWAAKFLGTQQRPSFVDIESAVGMDHLRPFYKLASHNVHANPKGILFKLGSPEEGMLLVGPSPYGLADPGQNTAVSLAVLIAHLTRICPAADVFFAARAARLLADEVATRFMVVHESLEGPADDAAPSSNSKEKKQ